LDASTSVGEGLRAAIAAQVAQLDQMVHSDTGQRFYQAVLVDRVWLIEQVTAAVLMALRQVVAAGGLAELVHAVDTEDVLVRLDMLAVQGSEFRYSALVSPDHGAGDAGGWRGPVWGGAAVAG
jgi:hypothetical protein